MKHASLFSGIGGFDLAAEWMGWENVFQCEKDLFCQKVLGFYWPNAKLYADIREMDGSVYKGAIDVLSGGFPCQPFSVAGKRRGTADDRHLWPEMYRVINEIRPRWVVGENVLGLLNWRRGMVFEQVQADLETAGYETWAYILPAAGIGAPHLRQRIFIVAHTGGDGCGEYSAFAKGDSRGKETGMESGYDFDSLHGRRIVADPDSQRWKRWVSGRIRSFFEETRVFAKFESSCRSAITNWDEFPTQSPFCSGNDGISNRLDNITFSAWLHQSIRAAGNAVVPGLVLRIFQTIDWMDKIFQI